MWWPYMFFGDPKKEDCYRVDTDAVATNPLVAWRLYAIFNTARRR